MRGTSLTEYAIALAVVLTIVLLATSLLNFVPGMMGSATAEDARMHWAQKTPVAILGATPTGGGLRLLMENQDKDSMVLKKVTVQPVGGAPYTKGMNVVFGPGQRRTVDVGALVPESADYSAGYKLGYCFAPLGNPAACDAATPAVDPVPLPCPNCNLPRGCNVAGATCGQNMDCCSNYCSNGQTCCLQNGDSAICQSDSECCDGSCQQTAEGKLCCKGGEGTVCKSPLDCCPTGKAGDTMDCELVGDTKQCVLHSSGGDNGGGNGGCIGVGGHGCASGGQCCDGYSCANDVCVSGMNGPCHPQGQPADGPSQCCAGTTYYDGFCRVQQGACTTGNDCMSGNCGPDLMCAAQPLGVCDARCSSATGIVCTGTVTSDCSNACQLEPAAACADGEYTECAAGACAVETACVADGGTCNSNADCCNRDCGALSPHVCGTAPACLGPNLACDLSTSPVTGGCCSGLGCVFNAPNSVCTPVCGALHESCNKGDLGCCAGFECVKDPTGTTARCYQKTIGPEICGNGVCKGDENCYSCPSDCGCQKQGGDCMKIVQSTAAPPAPVTTMAVVTTAPIPPGYALAVYSRVGEIYGYCMLKTKPSGNGMTAKISNGQEISKYVQSGCSIFTSGGAIFAYCG